MVAGLGLLVSDNGQLRAWRTEWLSPTAIAMFVVHCAWSSKLGGKSEFQKHCLVLVPMVRLPTWVPPPPLKGGEVVVVREMD